MSQKQRGHELVIISWLYQSKFKLAKTFVASLLIGFVIRLKRGGTVPGVGLSLFHLL
jgi:hypothetical protein